MNSFACGNLQQTVLILLLLGTALLQMFVAIEDVADQRYLPIVFDSALLMAELFYARTLLDAGRGIAGKSDFASETAFLWLMETGLFLYAAVRYIRIRMQVRNFLPRESIKEGSDNLPDGICYFDEYGTVSMTNKKMISIGMILFGKEIQTIDELHRENIRLAETNRRIKWMLDNMSDIVREKEILSMKVRVHDDIGHSILAAKKALVEHDPVRHLFLLAIRECVTNCVRHAGGDCVFVEVAHDGKQTVCAITNNGRPPQRAVVEGSGLSGLRRRIEWEGGAMELTDSPRFVLTVIWPAGEALL